MVAETRQRYTVEEFEAFVEEPEDAERLFEFVLGEIIEVPSNPLSSAIAALIIYFIQHFLREQGIKGHVTGEAGGYQMGSERYVPDAAYIAAARQAVLPYDQGYNPQPPDLAVEVISPTDSERHLAVKIANYLAAGTVVWVVYPETREVEVFRPGKAVQTFGSGAVLNGGDVLPGFTLPVHDIFPPQES